MNHMIKMYNLISDFDLATDLLTELKERKLSLKSFYILDNYFEVLHQSQSVSRPYFSNSLGRKELTNFFLREIVDKKKKQVIISLECEDGILREEKEILEVAYKKGARFIYIGVDASKYIPLEVDKKFKGCDFEKHFICANFQAHNFRTEIGYLIDEYPNKVFILGKTIVNIKSTVLADTISNILKKDDLFWIEYLSLRTGLNKEDDFKTFDAYVKYLDEPKIMNHYFHPLEYVGVPFENGKMIVDMEYEDSAGALNFIYSFYFKKKTKINFRGEEIIFLPKEKVELTSIRVFDMNTFVQFFEAHNFKCIASEKRGNEGQFLFKKTK